VAREPQRRGSGSLQDVAARLERAGFRLLPLPEISAHYVFERQGFVALVERLPDGGFGQIGAPGLLTENAFAMLVWKHTGPVFVAKDREEPATEEQVTALRRFDRDLKSAIAGEPEN